MQHLGGSIHISSIAMARLRRTAAEASESVAIPGQNRDTARSTAQDTDSPEARPARRKAAVKYSIPDGSDGDDPPLRTRTTSELCAKAVTKTRTQIRLAPLQSLGSLSDLTIQDDIPEKARRRSPLKLSSRQLTHKRNPKSCLSLSPQIAPAQELGAAVSPAQAQVADQENESEAELDVEESIWCGSELDASSSEDDLPSPSTFFSTRRKKPEHEQPDLATQLEALSIFDHDAEASPMKRPAAVSKPNSALQRPPCSFDKENQDAMIRFSPPRSKKPVTRETMERPTTPPLPPPSPSKLKSPSKRAPRIPTPPGRPSLETFWIAGAINDWNDQYSPQKPLRSPRKQFEPQTKKFDVTPMASPAKLQSPSKRSKAELQARKDWDTRKITIAENFLTELDQTITSGQVTQLAESTGGVKLVWSKTLNSTAGRANWRRETTKSHSRSDPSKMHTVHKHFASIELAEKVLTYSDDCETKLLNVLAHEFCHLTNFMISGVKDQPHGASFKAWGKLASKAFRDRGIEVTTKHSYEIEYKFVWRCEDEECGMEFKRHSKSIDPKRHRCGQCKANLLQIKPVPRGGAKSTQQDSLGGTAAPQVSGYAAYVKQHFAILKKSMPGASHKDVMEALGKQYRAEKKALKSEPVADEIVEKKALKSEPVADEIVEKLRNVNLSVQEVIELE